MPKPMDSKDSERPTRRPQDVDAEIDNALETDLKRRPVGDTRVRGGGAWRSQWDDPDLEHELEASLEGFDSKDFDVASGAGGLGRQRAEQREFVPKGERGQEGTPGARQGKLIAVRGKSVFIDLGGKSEGVVPVEQFEQLGREIPERGTLVDVMIDRYDPTEGLVLLVLKGATMHADWSTLHKEMIVEARVTKVNTGGLEVEVDGMRGFMPISQIDLNRVEDASVYLNTKLRAIVSEVNARAKNLVVSRKELLMREREELKAKTWAELEEGQVKAGVVRSIKNYGAFVDIGGVDGLLHIADVAWGRIKDLKGVLHVGQSLDVKVLKIDQEAKKVGLGLKQLSASPWETIEDRFDIGQTVKGKVTRTMEFGAFVELEPGIEGLIHVSELANRRIRRVADVVQPDQEVDVRILDIDPETRKIALSLKPDPKAPPETNDEPAATDESTPSEEPATPAKPKKPLNLKGGLGDRDKIPPL